MARTPPTVVRRALKIKEPKIRMNSNNRALTLFHNGTVTPPRGNSRLQHDPAVLSTLLQSIIFSPAPSDEEEVLPQVLTTLASVDTPSDVEVSAPGTSGPGTPCPKGSAGSTRTNLAIRGPLNRMNFATKRKREERDEGEEGGKENLTRKKIYVACLEGEERNAKDLDEPDELLHHRLPR
ncbi:hypothetical protein L218DRAFT_987067 [Marasmius fiardii PR-910]|nr:hypothetical protein L218DRAFT_987067 [Marasmius fiardii PR-910]